MSKKVTKKKASTPKIKEEDEIKKVLKEIIQEVDLEPYYLYKAKKALSEGIDIHSSAINIALMSEEHKINFSPLDIKTDDIEVSVKIKGESIPFTVYDFDLDI